MGRRVPSKPIAGRAATRTAPAGCSAADLRGPTARRRGAAERERARKVDLSHARSPGEVGDRASDRERSVLAASCQLPLLPRLAENPLAARVQAHVPRERARCRARR